jgi:hypothetical protein
MERDTAVMRNLLLRVKGAGQSLVKVDPGDIDP